MPAACGTLPSPASLRIGVLGPLRVAYDAAPVTPPGGRVGLLLAVVAMSAGHPVSVDRLASLMWPER